MINSGFSLIFYILFFTVISVYSVQVPKLKLNNGIEIPVLGLGTWKSNKGQVTQAVKDAIDAGYRHIDCAWVYGNEKEVGDAIRAKIEEGVVKREDLFIVSKLWNTFHDPKNVELAINQSLNALGLNYLDMYLMHFPMDFKHGESIFPVDKDGYVIPEGIDYVDTWKAMEKLYSKGLTKSIGVSNFNISQIERVLKYGSVIPVTNQVECHPYFNQKELVEYCKTKGITVTAYSPFGSPDRPGATANEETLFDNAILKNIAQKHKKSVAQTILRYIVQRGLIVIPKSVTKKRIEENINIFDFQLTSEEMESIDSLNKNFKILYVKEAVKHRFFPYNDVKY